MAELWNRNLFRVSVHFHAVHMYIVRHMLSIRIYLPQGCQMTYFQTKNPNLGKFCKGLAMEEVCKCYGHFDSFMAIWYILWPFNVYFYVCLVHLFPFWYVVKRKIWQPCIIGFWQAIRSLCLCPIKASNCSCERLQLNGLIKFLRFQFLQIWSKVCRINLVPIPRNKAFPILHIIVRFSHKYV
jgi:hypothetical protein